MALSPPYRLNDVQDINNYSHGYKSRIRTMMADFASTGRIIRPPIFSKLPDKFELSITEIKKKYWSIVKNSPISIENDDLYKFLKKVNENYQKMTASMPADFIQTVLELKKEGRTILQIEHNHDFVESLSDGINFPIEISLFPMDSGHG